MVVPTRLLRWNIIERKEPAAEVETEVSMLGPIDFLEAFFVGSEGRGSRTVVLRSYLGRSGQLAAHLHRRCATLVDIGGQVDEMESALGLLT
jgi:hypothetical protein